MAEPESLPTDSGHSTQRRARTSRKFGVLAVLGASLLASGVVIWLVLSARATTIWTVEKQKLHFKIVEPGFLEAVDKTDVFCRVKSRTPGSTRAVRIKWLIEDGATVKKGDKLVELDDTPVREARKAQEKLVVAAKADWSKAGDDYRAQIKKNQEDMKKALEDKRLKAPERELVKKLAYARETQAASVRRSKELIYEQELAKQQALDKDLASCILYAPRAGFVLHVVPEDVSGRPHVELAVGALVTEGQRLMSVCDLKRMQVKTQVREALRPYVSPRLAAEVHVEAYPGRTFTGHVAGLAKAPTVAGSNTSYPAVVMIDDLPDDSELRPEMSARVAFLSQTAEVVTVPLHAVQGIVALGRTCTCQVLDREGQLQERDIIVGVSNDDWVEVREGLEEGERVVVQRRPASVQR